MQQFISGEANGVSWRLRFVQAFCPQSILLPAVDAVAANPSADLPNGRYAVIASQSGKCVTVAAASKANGGNIEQDSCSGSKAQAFAVSNTGSGWYKLQNVNSAKVMDVNGSSTADGGNIDQWQDFAAANQRFSIQRLNGNLFTIVNQNSGKCVDVVGGYTTDGANIQQWTCNGNPQQHYQFVPTSVASGGSKIAMGRYTLTSVNSGKCLDVAGSGTTDGTNIQQYSCNGTGAQAFDLMLESGYYHLINANSGKGMEVSGSGTADGTNIDQWTVANTDNQRFSFVDKGNGQYNVVEKQTGKCVDVVGQYTTDGANVQLWTCNGQTNQLWTLAPSAWGQNGGSTTAVLKQHMMSYFGSITGNHTLVGVENKDSSNPTGDTDQITSITGRVPSFWGGDFGFGSAVDYRQTMINEAQKQFASGTLVGLMYHACPPTMDESCSWDQIGGNTPVHLSDSQWQQLLTPGTSLYNTWIGRLDTLAGYFQQLKNENVVVLFRPLHEMNQCVFWWACHTGTYSSARLYQITHDYLANTKGLDNIIWVWNVQDFSSLNTDVNTYNPGTSYFDIASLDVYNTGYTTNNYNAMLGVAAGKPIAIAECQFMPTSSLLASQNRWIYAMLWPDFISQNAGSLPSLYAASNVLTLDEMPGWH
jgi:hypothetical protein